MIWRLRAAFNRANTPMAAFKLTQLRHFSTVAEMKSIGVAAKVLHISQPALTRSIQRLEKETDGPLFERGSKGVALTPRGEALLPYVRAMLAEADRATQELRELRGQRQLRITLGASANFTQHICPDVIVDFVAEFPDSSVRTVTGTGEQLISMLSSAELDLAITVAWGSTLQIAMAKNLDLAHERLADMRACVFAPAGHALAGRGEVSLERLSRERWAVPHGLSLSYVFQEAFASRNLPAPVQVVNSSNVAHMLALSKRLGLLLIIPQHLAGEDLAAGDLTPVNCQPLQLLYQVEMITRRHGTQTPGLNRFRELAREHFGRAALT